MDRDWGDRWVHDRVVVRIRVRWGGINRAGAAASEVESGACVRDEDDRRREPQTPERYGPPFVLACSCLSVILYLVVASSVTMCDA